MKCEELLAALNATIDDESAATLYAEFAEHLLGCNPCQVVVDNIRRTISLFRNGEPYPMPQKFQERFRDSLKAKWKARFPDAAV